MTLKEFDDLKIGDLVIGNARANLYYAKTIKDWRGIVIEKDTRCYFKAKPILMGNNDYDDVYSGLNYKCFNVLCSSFSTVDILAKKIGFKGEL